jgi:hypothetical protein
MSVTGHNSDNGGGGGGGNPQPGYLNVQLVNGIFNFGGVANGSVGYGGIIFQNSGGTALSVTAISIDNAQFAAYSTSPPSVPPMVYPFTIQPGNNPIVVTFKFTAQPGGGTIVGNVTVTTTGAVTKTTFQLQATQTVLGGVTFALTPALGDAGQVKVGTAQAPITVTVENTSTAANLTISSITGDAVYGYAISAISTYGPIAPGGSATFNVTLTPTKLGYQYDTAAVVVTTNADVPTLNMSAAYTGNLVLSAFSLLGTTNAFWMSGTNSTGQAFVLQADPTNLTCEEPCQLIQQHDMELPELVKTLERVLLRYERAGATQVNLQLNAIRPKNQAQVVSQLTLDAGTDGALVQDFFDGSISGDIVQLKLFLNANAGPLSIAMIDLYYDPRGEKIEAT